MHGSPIRDGLTNFETFSSSNVWNRGDSIFSFNEGYCSTQFIKLFGVNYRKLKKKPFSVSILFPWNTCAKKKDYVFQTKHKIIIFFVNIK